MSRRFIYLAALVLLAALVGGCRFVIGMPSWAGHEPPVDPWPPATTDWRDSGALAGAVNTDPATTPAILGKLYTKSDGNNLYVKVTYDTVGYGFNFYLLVDNIAVDNGYNPSRWDSTLTFWWGNMGLQFEKNGTMFFTPDLAILRAREWGGPNPGKLVEADWARKSHAIIGPDEGNIIDVGGQVTVEQNEDGSEYIITIPYSAIGTGAKSGDRLQLIAMVGRDTWGDAEGVFLPESERPLGIQSAIPFSGKITDEGTPEARISFFDSAVYVTLK